MTYKIKGITVILKHRHMNYDGEFTAIWTRNYHWRRTKPRTVCPTILPWSISADGIMGHGYKYVKSSPDPYSRAPVLLRDIEMIYLSHPVASNQSEVSG